jgi:F0F1-type ATP synthase delta subunit
MDVRTVREATELMDLIDKLKGFLFQTDLVQFRKTLQDNVMLSGFLQKKDLSTDNKEVLLALLDEKKSEILKMPQIKLTIAIDPEDSFLDKICSWFSANTGKTFLLDIAVDASIVGGLLITYNGIYRDLSLKTKLNNYFNKFPNAHELLGS